MGVGQVGSLLAKLLENCGMPIIGFDRKAPFFKLKDIPKFGKRGDILINTATPKLNEFLLKLAAKKEMHYIDLASDMKDGKAEQLAFDKIFKRKKLKGVINCGLAPGLTNICISLTLKNEKVVKMRSLEHVESKVPILLWSPEVCIEDYNAKPLVYKNGKIIEGDFNSEIYNFPKYGKFRVEPSIHDEVATVPENLGLEYMDVKVGGKLGDFERLAASGKKFFLFTPALWKVVVTKMVFEVVFDLGKRKPYFIVDYKRMAKKNLPGNVITYPAALVASSIVESFDSLKDGVIAPESLPKNVKKRVLRKCRKVVVYYF